MINSTAQETTQITTQCQFTGIRHHLPGPPTAGLRIGDTEVQLTVDQADQLASAATVMAAQLHMAADRDQVHLDPYPL